jgi:hypothetical protein
MRMPGQVWLTLVLIIFAGWCGGADRAAINHPDVGVSPVKQLTATNRLKA